MQEREGLLDGHVTLCVDSTISGAQQQFLISTSDETEVYTHIEGRN